MNDLTEETLYRLILKNKDCAEKLKEKLNLALNSFRGLERLMAQEERVKVDVIENDFLNVTLLALLIALSGIVGNTVGYWFGSKSGYYLFKKEDSFWFKKKYLLQSKDFFEKYGGKAIIYARFLPIFRTFAPIVAGIVSMDKKKFMFYNTLSSFVWSFTLVFSGHYLYGIFLNYGIDLKEHIEMIVIAIVLISTFPVIMKLAKKRIQ
jgi:membrane-associated protein